MGAASARDPFSDVVGSRRGSGRPDAPDEPARPWWCWPGPHQLRLSEWLDHVIEAGYVDLEVRPGAHNNEYTLAASRPAGVGGYAVLDVDAAAVLWLEDHWPDHLITGRSETRLCGWLVDERRPV